MNDKIRVLLVMGSMAGGGSERQVLGLLRHLDRRRFAPVLYLVYRRGELLSEVPADVPVFAFWDDYRPPRLNYPGRIHRSQVRHLGRVLRQQAIQVVYDRTLLMALIAGPAAKRERVPRVSVVVADPRRDFDDQAGAFRWLKRRLVQNSYRAADRVVALSEDLQAGVTDFYRLPADRVVVARNGIDLERVDAMMQESVPDVDASCFHIVSAGRLQEQKGFKYLIEALSIVVHQRGHAHLRLHILGQGPLESNLRAQVDDCGLGAHVQFHGFQTNPFGYFRRANLFCLASLFEGTPNVLMEAMACRVPVIATDCLSGPRELLQDGTLGCLVPPGDANALADAIDQAVTRYDVCLRRVEPARQWLETELSLTASVRRTEELLVEVAGRESANSND